MSAPATTPNAAADHAARPTPPRLESKALLAGGREIVILHRGDEYRLRLTSNDKLILTK